MNGRSILFNRCFGRFLAYIFCGLIISSNCMAAIWWSNEETGKTTRYPDSFTLQEAPIRDSRGYSFAIIRESSNCSEKIAIGDRCLVYYNYLRKDFNNGSELVIGLSGSLGFVRLRFSPCDEKANQSAGVWNITMPGTRWENGSYVKTNADAQSGFIRSGSPSCDGSCALISDGGYLTDSAGKNVYGNVNSGTAYGKIKMKWTGAECTSDPNAKDPPKPSNSTSSDPSFTPPKGQPDCPAKTTYGEVNGVKRCVKNAPLPTDPNPPPKPGDPDACIGDCSKWDPSKDTGKDTDPNKPTDPSKPGGTTTGKGPLGSDASKPASENASGPGDSSLAASCTDFKCKNKDPATCEIARLAWNNKCIEEKAFKELTESELYKSGNKSMSSEGLDDMKTKLNFNGEGTFDMEGTIKTDRFLSGGGLADVSVTVMNQSFSLPFSKLNKYLSMCGDICVAFSLIAAARILSSAV